MTEPVPLHLPIHARAKGFIIVGAEADIEYRRSVFVLLDQLSACILVLCIIQVDIFIPRRDQQPCWRAGRELEGRYRVGGGLRKLELYFYNLSAVISPTAARYNKHRKAYGEPYCTCSRTDNERCSGSDLDMVC